MRRASALLLAPLVFAAACEDDGGLSARQVILRHPERIDFGRVPVGLGRALDFEIENAGDLPVRVLEWQTDASAGVEVGVRPGALDLPAGAKSTVTVRFSPERTSDEPIELTLRLVTDLPGDDAVRTLLLTGRGVRDGLRLSPSPLDFGRVLRGKAARRTLTVTSILPEGVELGWEVEPGGGWGSFSAVEPSPDERGRLGVLDPGVRGKINIEYRPAPNGPPGVDRATAVVDFCGASTCELEVPLIGEAIIDPLECAPDPVAFGVIRPNRQRTEVTVCTNVGQSPIRVVRAAMILSSAPELSTPEVEPIELAPGASTSFEVRIDVPRDAALGALEGTLRLDVQDDEGGRLPDHLVRATARVGGAALAVRPAAVDFGRVAVGLSARATVELRNAGADVLTVNGFEASPPFSVPSPPNNVQLVAGETYELELGFEPTAPGAFEGVLRLSSDALENPRAEVRLGGVALDLRACDAVIDPGNLTFGEIMLFRSTTRGLQVRNEGTAACLLREARVSSGQVSPFALVAGGERDVLLQPGEAWTYVIGFRPGRLGLDTGTFEVQVSNREQPTLSAPLRGGGTTSGLIASPDEIDFGEVTAGCASEERVRIHNPGDSALRVRSVQLQTVGSASSFRLAGLPPELVGAPPAGLVLGPGEAFELVARFVPAAMTSREIARIEIATEGSAAPLSIALYGEADPDPFVSERWLQGEASSVDVLFVIDNSTSMGAEQEALRRSFPRFIRYAEQRNLDFRVGVVSTDAYADGVCRRSAPTPLPGTPRGSCGFLSEGNAMRTERAWRLVENGEQPSPREAFDFISDVGIDGSAVEAGLRAAALAVDPLRLTGWNAGLLRRPEAFFGVVVVSDEEDQSPDEVRLYEALLASAKGARYRERYAFSGIIIDPAGCGALDATGRYISAIRRSGGTLGSICESNFDDTIDRIARGSAGVRERFPLRRPPFSPSVEVTVNGVPLGATSNGKTRWRFDADIDAVVFEADSVPREGSEVVVRYRPRCGAP